MEKKTVATSSIADLNKISEGTVFTGDVESNGDFRIDGKLKGSIKTSGRVVVGQNGQVEGTLNCSNAEIEGLVIGTIIVEELLAVKSTGQITNSDATTNKLSIEIGATFNATCKMK